MSDPGAAAWAAYGRLLASHADRERVIGVLKTAFVQGRLTKNDFESGIGRAFSSRTYADLAAITASIPAAPVTVWPGYRPTGQDAPVRNPASAAVTWSTGAAFMAVTLVASMFLDPGYFLLVAGVMFGIVVATGAQLLYARQQRRMRAVPSR